MIEIIQLCQLQSANVAAEQSVNSLFIIYVILSLCVNRPSLLLAYISSELLFQLAAFDKLPEWNLYAIEFIIYSYVFKDLKTNKNKLFCAVILLLSLYFLYDASNNGATATNEGYQTFFHEHVSSMYVLAHLLFIASFISIRRIRNSLRNIVGSFTRVSNYGYYLLII